MPTKTELPSLRGRFLTFEGVDGCGKSTQAALVADRIERAGVPVVRTREPGGTNTGRALRRILLEPEYRGLAAQAELLLFLADRVQHLQELIRPALERGAVVVCDRFHDATVAFQRYARNLDFAQIQPWIDSNIRPMPDLTVWLDVGLDLAMKRLHAREGLGAGTAASGALTRLELEPSAFHQRVRAGYGAIAEADPARVIRIDGAGSIEAVHETIWAQIAGRFQV